MDSKGSAFGRGPGGRAPGLYLLSAALACLLPAAGVAWADDPGSAWDWAGLSGSLRTGYWSSDRNIDSRTNFAPTSIWLTARPQLPGGAYAGAEAWALDQSLFHSGNRVWTELRQGYVGWRNDTFDISIGRNIVSWGRTDQINPTDVITPRNYTRMFVDDTNLQEGITIVRASYGIGDLTASAFWLPEFRPNIYPVQRLPGTGVEQGTDQFRGDQFAVRLDRSGRGFDWSVSYFNG
ncbi:MAG TPA: hypothetical protein VMU34_06770, partial [Mycobacterium sp.]|nr:hypothetical protein [Mycobacterium sp.]